MAVAVAVASRGDLFGEARDKALAAREGRPLANTRSVTTRDGVAEIPITGTMFRHADLLSAISGGVSYATLRKDLQAALDDSSVAAILLNVDSPGGEVNGCAELADAIYTARSVKPIAAYVGGSGCSAAYWLASAAERVYCASTSQLGSIGTCASYVDSSKADEASGKRTIQIKSTQSPDKNVDPSTDRGAALAQQRLDAVAEVFIGDVARFRGVDAKTVARDFGRGGVLIGADAVRVGMADAVGNYESALADMAKRGAAAKHTEMFMAQEQERLAALAAFERDAFVALGAKNAGEALGIIAALQVVSNEAASTKADLVALKKSTVDAEAKRLCDDAAKEGRLPPAKRAEVDGLYAKYGIDAVKATLSLLPVVAQSASEGPKPVAENAAPADPAAKGAALLAQFSATELKIARQMTGGDAAALEPYLIKLAKFKQERAAGAAR